jgi:hypothetical protein
VLIERSFIEWLGVLEGSSIPYFVSVAVSPGAVPAVVAEVHQALNRLRHLLGEHHIEAFDIFIHCLYLPYKNQKPKQLPATVAGQPIGPGEFVTE